MLNTLKVLYIEDDKNTRDALSYYLKKRTGKLIIAGMGTDALEQYNIHNPEIIIVDLLLPDMNGLEVIKEIRENSKKSIIIVGTPTWSQEVDKPAKNKINDEQVMYALHFYSGTHTEWLRERVKEALKDLSLIHI